MKWTCPKCPSGTEKVKGRSHCRLCERKRVRAKNASHYIRVVRPEIEAKKCRWAVKASKQYLSMSLIKRED